MAYTLKSTGIAANLVHCIGVDGGVVKDFKNVATISDWVDDADASTSSTVGTAQWRSATSNSSSHEYFVTSGNARPKFGTKPTFNLGPSRSIFIAFQDSGGNSGEANNQNRYFIATSAGAGYVRAAAYGGIPVANLNLSDVALNCSAGNALAYAFTGQKSYLFSTTGVINGGSIYVDGSNDGSASITSNTSNLTFQPSYIGCLDTRLNAFVGRIFLIAQFDTDVSASASALNDDWFGTLFESGASAVTKTAYYAMLRNA